MLSDDVRLAKDSDAKRLLVEFNVDKLNVYVETLPKTRLVIECSDPGASRELGLVLLQWISRTSYQKNVEVAFGLPSPKKKRKGKS